MAIEVSLIFCVIFSGGEGGNRDEATAAERAMLVLHLVDMEKRQPGTPAVSL